MIQIKVLSATALDAETQKKITAFIQKKHSEPFEINYILDGSILGGVLIIDGDDYYDGTLKSQLIKIKKGIS